MWVYDIYLNIIKKESVHVSGCKIERVVAEYYIYLNYLGHLKNYISIPPI